MTDRRKQLRVGIFTLITLALVAVAVIAFGSMKFWKHHDHYYVLFDDSVLGLSAGAPVSLNGISVGTVDSVRIAPSDLSKVEVRLEVDAGTPIHADTKAFLSMAGFTGVRSIDLKGGSYAAPQLAENGTIQVGVGFFDKLQAKAELLADESGKLMEKANAIVDGANRVMTNLSTVTDPAAIQAILENTRKASLELATASRGIVAMVGETRTGLSTSLASVTATANSATSLLDDKVAGFVDSAGALITDLRTVVHGNGATLQAATADIRQAARSFKELSREVREKPSRLIFSGSQPDRKLP